MRKPEKKLVTGSARPGPSTNPITVPASTSSPSVVITQGEWGRKTPAAGATPPNGCGVINVYNVDSIYSFHPQGATVLRGDGSVTFLRDSTGPGVLGLLLVRDDGIPVTTD